MLDSTYTASRISSDWPAVVGKLPKPLADVIQSYDEVEYATASAAAFPAGLSPQEVPAAVEKLAADLAVADYYSKAKQQAKAALANQLLWAASEAVPAILKGLAPEFQTAVQAYTAAVQQLPDPVSSQVLIASDPALVAAYQNGVAAAKTIRKIDGFLASLADVPEHGAGLAEPQLRVCDPQTRAELTTLLDTKARSDAEEQLVPLYLAAARHGIGFAMHTPAEARERRKYLDALPVVRKQLNFVKF